MIFTYFGKLTLLRINITDSPVKIMRWKKNAAVTSCYQKLFANNYKTLVEIVNKVFGDKGYTNLEMTYVISICTTILNLKNNRIKCQESLMKKKIDYYLVSFIVLYLLLLFFILFNNFIIKYFRKK